MFAIDDMDPRRSVLSLEASSSGFLCAANLEGLRHRTQSESEWTTIFPRAGEPPIPVTAVAISPSDVIFAGIAGGIVVSSDRGATWSATAFPEPAPVFTTIAVSPDDRVILAGTEEDGAFRSIDGGRTWEPWNFGLIDPSVTAIAFTGNGPTFIGSSTGLFISSNHGRSWKAVRLESSYEAISSIVTHAGSVWVETDTKRWWRSIDAGKTWSQCAPVLDQLTSTISSVISIDGTPGVYGALFSGEVAFLPLRF